MNEEQRKEAQEFIDSKWLWWINRILHTFGWVIMAHFDDTEGTDVLYFSVKKNYTGRGFGEEAEDNGYEKVGLWLENNIQEANKIFDTN